MGLYKYINMTIYNHLYVWKVQIKLGTKFKIRIYHILAYLNLKFDFGKI